MKRTLAEISSCPNRHLGCIAFLFSYLPGNPYPALNLLKPNHHLAGSGSSTPAFGRLRISLSNLTSFNLLGFLFDAKGKLPRETLWMANEKSIREWTDKAAGLIDGIAADLAKNGVGVAFDNMDLRDGAVGIDKETNDDSISTDLCHGLLNF